MCISLFRNYCEPNWKINILFFYKKNSLISLQLNSLLAGLVHEILIEQLLIICFLYLELIELEENDEPDNVEDDEEEAAEGNNSDEEWDAYEELDLVIVIYNF